MGPEEFNLLDDVVVTLENDGELYRWFMLHGKTAWMSTIFEKFNKSYQVTRQLRGGQEQQYLVDYFKWRWLQIGEQPTYPRLTSKAVRVKPFKYDVEIPTETTARANGDAKVSSLIDQINQTLKEIPVSKLSFKQQFLLNGTDVSAMPASSVYAAIKAEEDRIADLEKLQNKPKRLVKEIEAAKAEIKALVDFLDSKTE